MLPYLMLVVNNYTGVINYERKKVHSLDHDGD